MTYYNSETQTYFLFDPDKEYSGITLFKSSDNQWQLSLQLAGENSWHINYVDNEVAYKILNMLKSRMPVISIKKRKLFQ